MYPLIFFLKAYLFVIKLTQASLRWMTSLINITDGNALRSALNDCKHHQLHQFQVRRLL